MGKKKRIGRFVSRALRLCGEWRKKPYYGFIQGHRHLSAAVLRDIGATVGTRDSDIVREYERRFAELVGGGECVSFAAGRMGFYCLMKVLGIGAGDEVILPGFTCSVMVNAVLRLGAKPVFSDISTDTLGSHPERIAECISSRTAMIVAQHSFGIPCDIHPIVQLSRDRKIFLLEDCALSLGSTVSGVPVGNFGDAALFSTDHSKPLNTLVGGVVYSRRSDIIEGLRMAQGRADDLPEKKQKAMWLRLLKERRYCHSSAYGKLKVLDFFRGARARLFRSEGPFLDEDYGAGGESSYPYPAKLPTFLAKLGVHEVNRWRKVASQRSALLRKLLAVASSFRDKLPGAYADGKVGIVPLRFAWWQGDGPAVRCRLSYFVDVSWTWFMQPIIATPLPLEALGYKAGICPIAERVGRGIVNLPCNVSVREGERLLKEFSRVILIRDTGIE